MNIPQRNIPVQLQRKAHIHWYRGIPQPARHKEFRAEQALVQQMEVRAIAIPETPGCALLATFEIYASLSLRTPHNSFCTH